MRKLFTIAVLSLAVSACSRASEGTVIINEGSTGISEILRPSSGYSAEGPTEQYHVFHTTAFTVPVDVNASTKDNAAVLIKVSVTVLPPQGDEEIKSYVRKFGLDSEVRKKKVEELLQGQVNTETKNQVIKFEAYGLLANQQAVQSELVKALKPILASQMYLNLESIQILGRPDFVDDRIENAASAVVANQKDKEAAQAAYEKAQVEAQRKELEARTFANPAMLDLEKLKLQLQIEQARAHGIAEHKGNLTIVNGSVPQLHLKD